ncbi:MAG: transporter substrate-binding domain-containing protein [Chloroflexota bacterium]
MIKTQRLRFLFIAVCIAALVAVGVGYREIFSPTVDPTWEKMIQRGTWRIGIDPSFPPFESLDEDGSVVGFDLALAKQIAIEWGVTVEIVPIGFDSLIDAVQTQQVDSVVSALPYDPRLTKDIGYSLPYFDAGIRLAVRFDSTLYAKSQELVQQEDGKFSEEALFLLLNGRRIGVEWGGLSDMIGRRIQRAGHSPELLSFSSPENTVDALFADSTIDGILVDNVTLVQAQAEHPIIGIGPIIESVPYVIASSIDATILQEQINIALTKLKESGQLEQLSEEWF